jgi:hypothetical protein
MNPLDFVKNVLTDVYKDKTALKADALQVYTSLIQDNPLSVIMNIPFSGQVLTIPSVYYHEAFKLIQEGKKINAIKCIREPGPEVVQGIC